MSKQTPPRQDLIGRFAQHKVAANLLMVILFLGGIFALSKLNRQFFPDFALDFITVRVIWPGASAEDVDRSITTPLEQALRNLDNVKEMRSTSGQGFSVVVLEYEENSDMGVALDQVNEFVSTVRNLPSDAERPEVSKFNREEDIATLILSGHASLDELRFMAHKFEDELLARGIAKVEFTGLPDQEIAIEIPSQRISELGQSLPMLGQRIQALSQDIPAGTVGDEESAREVRSLEKRRTASGFADLPIITSADGQRLTLGDIASIKLRPKENTVTVFYQDQPAILLKLKRTASADTLVAARIMEEWLTDTRPLLPEGIQLTVFDEQYQLIQDRINLLVKNGISGLILVVGILYIFLNGRVAFWVAAGIPVSFMGAIAILWLNGGSINMISLFALIMTLGIIVDDAIVVAEDAMTHYDLGERSLQAAEGGARRMLVPVMASSLTTIAAFLPLMMVGGIIGKILIDIPFVVVCIIIASLIESFLILPGHLRGTFHRFHHQPPSPTRQRLENGFNHFRDQIFRPVAHWTLNNRAATLTGTLAALVLAVGLVSNGFVRFTFFPSPEGTRIYASVKFAAGTPPSQVKSFGHRMEKAVWEVDKQFADEDLVKIAVLSLNQATFTSGSNMDRGNQYAMLSIELTQPDDRSIRNPVFIKALRDALPLPAGVEQLSISSPQGGPPGRAIDLFLIGADAQTLKQAAEELKEHLRGYQGVSDILDDLPWGKQQYLFQLTPQAQSLGLTINDVGRQMRAALDGQLLQVFQDTHDEIEVRIRLPKAERELQNTLDTLPIVTPTGSTTPLASVIRLESRRGLELLRHTDGQLGVHVTADVDSSVTNANLVLSELDASIIPGLMKRYGIQVNYKGKAQEQKETGADMASGALIGLALIYIILSWVFSSYIWPLAVMIAIPFGLCGAILGHWLLGIDLTILSQFGMFGLSGIVINDSIILVTFYQELRQKGMPVQAALLEASCQRLRAVMLTSLTTICGLLPLVLETSLQAQFLIPMAISITFGLAVSTLLILLVVPALLSLFESGKVRREQASTTAANTGTS